ncbi:cysteine-rich receptor-like protein kinase 10-like [Dorcoceras hygrometricum]|uniref:Cysteine-rich receptor-like protein kinase 10-like n=1 Tax=Dorcoceras hygrometricum TaxID=472368 RepID=A0A2Z7AAU1_9LAMI|nr:cysteine-rich receptor-like protein kinase 10-like [Dorcoceras hygrometricum]
MGNADPNKTKAGNKYEVKPQYEELSNQTNMQYAIKQCYECMRLSKEISQLGRCNNRQIISCRLYTTVYQPGNHRSVIIGARQPSQLGGRHSYPVVTAPTIALDFSGTTQQSASHNVVPKQALATRTELKSTRNAHPKAHASRRRTHRLFLKSFELQQLRVSTPALIQRLKWVANERAKQGESSATKIVKNKGWMRWESAVENHGEHRLNSRDLPADTSFLSFSSNNQKGNPKKTLQNDTVPTYQNDAVTLHQLTTALTSKTTKSCATAESSSQHSKMLTNTCRFLIYLALSATSASSDLKIETKTSSSQCVTLTSSLLIQNPPARSYSNFQLIQTTPLLNAIVFALAAGQQQPSQRNLLPTERNTATAESSSQHSKMLTNTCRFLIYLALSATSASSDLKIETKTSSSHATAESSSQHSKMLTNTCRFLIYLALSATSASSDLKIETKTSSSQCVTLTSSLLIQNPPARSYSNFLLTVCSKIRYE